ncbi:hypothetical protein A2Z00_05545 [Candidatus Gottesmanbacteria bacterium RBG_13_45_10]|uniref:ATP synthase F1 complex delta/epsilon subunit N-terminal domain-containing protein n=1 Tax=Candidatus Gottesmanbacteria bacterium RBG_13_45_10 TaxID=1798370 RepID=A0A1F5ZG53_9BACT|nr:MAG: hypothetical protein A2Z00_05545 [Candidatus Gottesmanbacteria bacterium RBG_13_45_10]
MAGKLHVRINTPEKMLWEGDADSVSSINTQGPFDILPLHTNFVSIVENHPIKIRIGREEKEYTFPHSLIYAHLNKVFVYTNI